MTEGIRRLLTLVTVFLVMFAAVYLMRNGPAGFRQLFGQNDKGRDYRKERFTLPDKAPLELNDVELLSRLNDEYAMLTDAVVPSVVSIDTSGVRAQRLLDGYGRQHFRAVPTQGQGSGVIISHEGHVVTNYHVVKGQRKIQVTMHDGQVLSATLIGEDPILDIAVLKIESDGPFQPLKFGDSDEVRRGQITFAFGNPFGLGETVTQGIISAVKRSLSDTQQDLIQTDAAINPGNSGGPLVNLQGEIIGINSAIFRPDEGERKSGFQGVGFSIPSNDVKDVLFAILERGRLIHGYLGVQVDPNPLTKTALGFGDSGVVIGGVRAGSPAELAGLKANDVVVAYDGEPTEDMTTLFNLVQGSRVGQEVPIRVWRGGEILDFKARIVERKLDLGLRPEPKGQGRSRDQEEILRGVGLVVRDLIPAELKAGYHGVVVVEVSKGGLAEAKLAVGDLIETVNQIEVSNSEGFYADLAASAETQVTTLQLVRQRKRGRVTLPPLPQQNDESEKSGDSADSVDGATSDR